MGEASLLAVAGIFALVLIGLSLTGFKPNIKPATAEMLAILVPVVLLPAAIARWWMFPRLALTYSQREARAVSNAFGLCCPVALGVSTAVGGIVGGSALTYLWSSRIFALLGAFFGTILLAILLNTIVCALVLRVTRLATSVEPTD